MKVNTRIINGLIGSLFVFFGFLLLQSGTCMVLKSHEEIDITKYCLTNFDYTKVFAGFFVTIVSFTSLIFSVAQIEKSENKANKSLILQGYKLLYSLIRLIFLFGLVLLLMILSKFFGTFTYGWYILWGLFGILGLILVFKICVSRFTSTIELINISKERLFAKTE